MASLGGAEEEEDGRGRVILVRVLGWSDGARKDRAWTILRNGLSEFSLFDTLLSSWSP